MFLNLNKSVYFFFIVCFLTMAIPSIFNLGDGNVFKQDYLSKRIMTVLSFPFFAFILYNVLKNDKTKINPKIIFYIGFFLIVILLSFIRGNKIVLIVTDAFIALLPIFFYLLLFNTGVTTDGYKKNFKGYLILSSILVLFGVKLQFSYFTLITIIYILFFLKWKLENIFSFILLPIIAYKSLIGKSALLMLFFIIFYIFIFDSRILSKNKKIYFLMIPAVLLTVLSIFFWEQIQETGSYRNFVYFLRNADFTNFTFKDISTGHRLYEAKIVLDNFINNNFICKLFGNGFGSTIDLSGTVDSAVLGANSNTKEVRNIHMGFFAVLSRYGVIGVLIYLNFSLKMILLCFKTLKKKNHFSITLGCFYVLILIFDSFISFPHMMSNFLFWFICAVIFYENK